MIEIANPWPGGSSYTSVKKAREYVNRGRAIMDQNMLWFIDRPARPRIAVLDDVVYWNGSDRSESMRKPGEVRS